jgi:hypothetical protein
MRPHLTILAMLSVLGFAPALQAGPQTIKQKLDLQLLDLNGTPFRTFHLGHYQQELDANRPTSAGALPSAELRGHASPAHDDPSQYTGMRTEPAGPALQKIDVDALIPANDTDLMQGRGSE